MAPPATRHDLVEVLSTVDEAMSESPVAVSPEAPVSVALAILDERRVGGAPVVHGGRVVGVVTIADLVGRRTSAQHTGPFLRPHHEARDWSVADVMTETAVGHHRVNRSSLPSLGWTRPGSTAYRWRIPKGGGILARGDVVRAVARAARHGGTGGT